MSNPSDYTQCRVSLEGVTDISDAWELIEVAILKKESNSDPRYLKALRSGFGFGAGACVGIMIDILCDCKSEQEFGSALFKFLHTVKAFEQENTTHD